MGSDEKNEAQSTAHSPLVEQYLLDIALAADSELPVLDLACGGGRNGRYLAHRGLPVCFADRSEEKLEGIRSEFIAGDKQTSCDFWCVDFEQEDSSPLKQRCFGAILVFRYLHRPLLSQIAQAMSPGGVLIYETFTRDHAELGRPRNPDFLLEAGELAASFSDWELLHQFEGRTQSETGGREQAIAQLVARKPN